MIVVATWPVLIGLQRRLGGRRGLAVAVMTVILLLVLIVPLYFGVTAVVANTRQLVEWSRSVSTITVPPLPGWIEAIPFVGAKLAGYRQDLIALHPEDLSARLAPYAQALILWFVGQVGGIGLLFLQFLLTVVVSAILYANGETAALAVTRFARRLAGDEGENAVRLAGQAIRGVAMGVVVTAILQSAAAGLGIAVAGIPFAAILTVVMFMLCIAQIGPALVLLPAVFWIYATRGGVFGTAFLVWALFCATFDNLLRPMLIRRGADLPLLLIFTGVIGGLIAFGVVGLFIGPSVLAVGYMLLADWLAAGRSAAEA
jgi:predicted PurR-regulated permease PerM